LNKDRRIVVTGAAGLVGQNLVLMLRQQGYTDVTAIDKQPGNLALLARLNPGVRTLEADISRPGAWADAIRGADTVVALHAQITGKTGSPLFVRNNVEASRLLFERIAAEKVPFTIVISSSVVNSVADDDYTNTKRAQEEMFVATGLPGCVLRPTLMFGWFDPKHLGWLARFMEKTPVFPIPGHGRYMRQPLYERDFCRALLWCVENRPVGKRYDLVGSERIDYIDIIRLIKRVKKLRTVVLPIPYGLFHVLLRAYALVSDRPPFTADQLTALTAGDEFTGVDLEATFGFSPTPLAQAFEETFCDKEYARYVVERTD
jgi:nucleoside-diphosphate-sugar epimerase